MLALLPVVGSPLRIILDGYNLEQFLATTNHVILQLASFVLFHTSLTAHSQSWASEITETIRARRVDDLWASMKAEERAEPLKVGQPVESPLQNLGLAWGGIILFFFTSTSTL